MELKSTKKGKKSITEFVLRIKAIANTLLAVGDSISEQDQIDSILATFVDGYTRYTLLYFLKTKSETLRVFKLFHMFVKTQFHTTI